LSRRNQEHRVYPYLLRQVTAAYPNHVWGCDLTAVPTSFGVWTATAPFALPLRWPFCWWVVVVLDHFSRRVQGFQILE
jgi:hypothetical protein